MGRLTWQGLHEAEHTVPVHFSEHTAPPLWCWWSRAPAAGLSGEQRRPVARVQVAGDPLHPRTDTHSPAGCPLWASPSHVTRTWSSLSCSSGSRFAWCCAANTHSFILTYRTRSDTSYQRIWQPFAAWGAQRRAEQQMGIVADDRLHLWIWFSHLCNYTETPVGLPDMQRSYINFLRVIQWTSLNVTNRADLVPKQ